MPIFWGRVDKTLLEPNFLADVEPFLENSPYSWYVTEGFRSLERSAQLYAAYLKGGPRAAPAGKSAHNFGLAIDVSLDGDPSKPGNQPTWNTKMAGWVWLKERSIPHPRLRNGWSFNDWPHIERYKWQQFKLWSQQ